VAKRRVVSDFASCFGDALDMACGGPLRSTICDNMAASSTVTPNAIRDHYDTFAWIYRAFWGNTSNTVSS